MGVDGTLASGYISHLRHTQNPPCAAIYQEALNDIPASDPGEWDPKLDNSQQDAGEDDAIATCVIPVDGTACLL